MQERYQQWNRCPVICFPGLGLGRDISCESNRPAGELTSCGLFILGKLISCHTPQRWTAPSSRDHGGPFSLSFGRSLSKKEASDWLARLTGMLKYVSWLVKSRYLVEWWRGLLLGELRCRIQGTGRWCTVVYMSGQMNVQHELLMEFGQVLVGLRARSRCSGGRWAGPAARRACTASCSWTLTAACHEAASRWASSPPGARKTTAR